MCAVNGTMPAGEAAVLPAPGRGSHHWLRRALIVLGFLFGAWLISSLAGQQDARADTPPPTRPVLPVLPVTVTVPAVPDLAPVLTPVTAAASDAVTRVVDEVGTSTAQTVESVRTATRVIANRVTATAAGTIRQAGTALQPVSHLPRVRPVLQAPEVRHGAPTPRTSSTALDEVHRAVTAALSAGTPAHLLTDAGPVAAGSADGTSTAPATTSVLPLRPARAHAASTERPAQPAPLAPQGPETPVTPMTPAAPFAPSGGSGDHQTPGTGLAWIPTASPVAGDALATTVLEQRTTLHSVRFGAPTVSPD